MAANSHRFSLYKRSNGIYYVSYYHKGRRRLKSTGEHIDKFKTRHLQPERLHDTVNKINVTLN
ncbi:MAG: hypothetical protein O7D34_11755 [Ignavibacteria bacterium]|nr:hypothetical protein [Ignavibacteria bacterium]